MLNAVGRRVGSRRAAIAAIALVLTSIMILTFAVRTPADETFKLAAPGPSARCAETAYQANVLGSTHTLRGTICRPVKGKARAAALLIHGDTYSRVYWDFPLDPNRYSVAQALAGAGYLTLAIDRLGSGKSDMPPSDQVTPDVGADALHEVVQDLRALAATETSSGRVFVAGHSGGSTLALREAARFGDIDGLILTAFMHSIGPSGGLVPASFHLASEDPMFAGDASIPPGYITTQPASRIVFYYPFQAEERVYQADEQKKSVLPGGDSSGFVEERASATLARQIGVPVLIMVGAWDLGFCTPPECPEAATETSRYPASPDVSLIVQPRTGHDLNLHLNSGETINAMRRWLDARSR